VLALDALRSPGHVMPQVVHDFRTRHSDWAQCLGYSEIWLVGPTAALTYRLD
jgi:hypothetical protein